MVGVYAGRNRMRVAIIVLGVLLCSAATAEPKPWIRKEHPDTLYFTQFVHPDCPVSEAKLREEVNGVLIRSRIRPGDYYTSTEELGFYLLLNCWEEQKPLVIFGLNVFFIRWLDGRPLIEFHPMYGMIGRGNEESIKEAIRGQTERLVTDYLQANFNLAPE